MKPEQIRSSLPASKTKNKTVAGPRSGLGRTVPSDRKYSSLTAMYGLHEQKDDELFSSGEDHDLESSDDKLVHQAPPIPPSPGRQKVDLSVGRRTPSRNTTRVQTSGIEPKTGVPKNGTDETVVKASLDVKPPVLVLDDEPDGISDDEDKETGSESDPMLQSSSGKVYLCASRRSISMEASRRAPSDSVLRKTRNAKYLDFQIPIFTAKDHMIEWRGRQFTVPLDVTTRFSKAVITAVFCPFVLFTGIALTKTGVREFKGLSPELPSFVEEPAVEGKEHISRELLSHLSPWNFKKAQSKEIAEAQAKELAHCAGGFNNVKFLEPMSAKTVWEEEVKPHLIQVLTDTDGVPIGGNIIFDDVDWRIIFVPVYVSSFVYEGTRYMFALNGQTGECYGTKPFGLSGLFRGIPKFLSGAYLEGAPKMNIVKGDALSKNDKCDYYNNDHYYLVLPGTDSFLWFTSTGKCTLKNTAPPAKSSDPFENAVRLTAQARLQNRFANTAVIRPGETLEFSYKYMWVLEIVSGNPNFLSCDNIETSGGDPSQDKMGMVCGHQTDA